MPAVHHALLGASVVALAFAGLRLASPIASRGLPRLLGAATFATAAAVTLALLLALVSLGGNTVALTVAALVTGALAWSLLPRPEVGLGQEAVGWWRERALGERALIGAAAGAGMAWATWQLRHPALGFDAIHYHLPEMVLFVQGGQPGSINDVLPGLPVGNYPLTTEVTIAWAMGIARSFVPLILWPWVTLTLTAAAAWGGLRALKVPTLAAGLAATALCTNPWLLAWQSNGSVTDPPALAWLVVCAALVAMSVRNRALLTPAVVAGGLAIGCKTTVLPYTLLVLGIGLWSAARVRRLPMPLVFGTLAALVVGGFWYLRNFVDHGSPFWPLVASPWGDPLPRSVQLVKTSFLDHPRETIDMLHHAYLNRFGGGLILLAGALLAPFAVRRRRTVVAGLVTLAGLLLWARSPVTGIEPGLALPETVFSTTRYALPVVAAACGTLAVAAADARALRLAPVAVLAAAAVVNLMLTIRLHFAIAPAATTPLAGAAVGAAGAAILRPARLPLPGLVVPILVVVAATLLAIPADGFLKRHSDTGAGVPAVVARDLAADPAYREGSDPVATSPAYIGPLAGDRLSHPLEAIARSESCAAVAKRAARQWLVIYGGPLGGKAPSELSHCLPRPALDLGTVVIYRPTRAGTVR
ncbi:MAG: hypothetical protein QOJ12_1836 [Thermoleophilales bacterium]|jgi:hypothetical protein|nr:hypothetical protein [Thermoleophilales bacterium]